MEIAKFVERYPMLYHMAEEGTWPSIKAHGLLSTTAALDLFDLKGQERTSLEEQHRPEKHAIDLRGTRIVLRDQKPMHPDRLAVALIDGTKPSEWYKLLNSKVFMWAEEHRLMKLLNARGYSKLKHDVLSIDTAKFMNSYAAKVWLCHMNSGNTFPLPHRRGVEIFKRIGDYPTRRRTGGPAKEVVEVVTDYSIPDIAEFVAEVRSFRGKEFLGTIEL